MMDAGVGEEGGDIGKLWGEGFAEPGDAIS